MVGTKKLEIFSVSNLCLFIVCSGASYPFPLVRNIIDHNVVSDLVS